MKKILFIWLALTAFEFPLFSQVSHDYNSNDVVPILNATLTKDQIPASVLKAASIEFDLKSPNTWTKFPYAIKEYGFVYDKGASDLKPDRYEVTLKTVNGSDLFAVYSVDGNLVATREVFSNRPIPPSVSLALSNSKYKDWNVVGTKEVIRYYHDKNSVEQHFRLTVEKDNVQRSISFNYQGKNDK